MSVTENPDPFGKKNLHYRTNFPLEPAAINNLYRSAALQHRTNISENRIETMFKNANLIISAWDGDLLVGVARSLTDFSYCCYVSDLAVRQEYQKCGIGKELLRLTKEAVGDQVSLILLASDAAINYYPKVGLTKFENGFIIKRKE